MKITWLGQAGLLFEADGMKIIVDPYLSNSVVKVNPRNCRRVPVCEEFLKIKPDVLILTHNHLDHTDPETLPHYLGENTSVTVLAPDAAWQTARGFGGAQNNYVRFQRHTEWTQGTFRIRAVKAEHSDPHPIGVLIEHNGKTYYVTGDTLYNTEIFADLPEKIDVVFLPVNGVGNNMNMADAKRFAEKTGAAYVVPMHVGLFDSLDPNDFACKNKIVPEIYEEINLPEEVL